MTSCLRSFCRLRWLGEVIPDLSIQNTNEPEREQASKERGKQSRNKGNKNGRAMSPAIFVVAYLLYGLEVAQLFG